MKFKKFIIIPVMIAALAALIQIVDQLLCGFVHPDGNVGFGWISFQAWATYFLAGCNVKGGIRTFLGYLAGIVASILIMSFGGTLASIVGSFWAVPVALLILVIPVICLERVPWFDLVPALFIGAGAFFAFMSYVPNATFAGAAATELIYCLLGIFWGFMTITFRTWYEKKIAKE